MFKSSMTSPQALGKAISSAGSENAAHYLLSLILHRMVISIDPAQLDPGCPPQSLLAGREVLLFVPHWTAIWEKLSMKH